MDVAPFHYTAYGLSIEADCPLPPLVARPAPTAAPHLLVQHGHVPEPPAWHPTKISRAGMDAQFAAPGPNNLLLNWPPLGRFAALNGTRILLDTNPKADAGLVALFALSETLGLILFQRGYFLLHGSAVDVGGRALVFVGEPGAGKSTTAAAFARQGAPLLSDDMVCIQLDGAGGAAVIPAFPQLKLWQSAVTGLGLAPNQLLPVREGVTKFSWQHALPVAETAVPLAQIFVLQPAANRPGTLLPPSRVPVALLGHFPLAEQLLQGLQLRHFFEQSAALAQSVPVYEQPRPANFTDLTAFVSHHFAA